MQKEQYEHSINEFLDVPDTYLFYHEILQEWLAENKEYYEFVENAEKIRIANNILPPLKGNNHYESYKQLLEVSKCFENESYFKNEFLVYTSIKNNVTELNKWLNFHYQDKEEKISVFSMKFHDTGKLSGYRFSTGYPVSIKVNPNDFEFTVKVLNIIERSKKVKIQGIVVETFEVEHIPAPHRSVSSRPAYSRQYIVVEAELGNRQLIAFKEDKIQLLHNIQVGDSIIVYSELWGGKWENEYGIMQYQSGMIGWDVIRKNT